MAVVDVVVAVVLPEEIIMEEILRRLPVKSLVRCRCVCKSWNSQFYNPNFLFRLNHLHHRSSRDDDDDDYLVFMKNCYNRKTAPPYGLSILSCKKLSETRLIDNNNNDVPYPLSLDPYYIHLVGSINGLVCIAFRSQFILWNPMIRFSKQIIMVGIDINNCYSLVYGFGWDSVTNDYKLIAKPFFDKGVSAAAVYSCKTDCWTNITTSVSLEEDSSYLLGWSRHPSVIVNGFPYWYNRRDSSILKFDIPNNEFTYLINAPSRRHCDSRDTSRTNLVNLNDCLAFIDYNSYRGEAKVYRYDEQHNIWMHMYTFDKYMNHDEVRVHCFKYGGEIVFHGKKHRYLYDPNKSREIKSRLRRSTRCWGCLTPSRTRKRRGSHDYEGKRKDHRGCEGHIVNGFDYTPSIVALPGMKALNM